MILETVRQEFETSLQRARDAIREGNYAAAWPELERAHVIGQASAVMHVRAHGVMLVCGWRQRDYREIVGQIGRILAAVPASVLGIYPVGNTGRATVSAFKPMPIPDDLRQLIGKK